MNPNDFQLIILISALSNLTSIITSFLWSTIRLVESIFFVRKHLDYSDHCDSQLLCAILSVPSTLEYVWEIKTHGYSTILPEYGCGIYLKRIGKCWYIALLTTKARKDETSSFPELVLFMPRFGYRKSLQNLPRAMANHKQDKIAYYDGSPYDERWYYSKSFDKVPLESVGIDPSLRDELVDIADSFKQSIGDETMRRYGQPKRKTLLLHGLPGVGKTKLMRMLASHLNMPIYDATTSLLDNSRPMTDFASHVPPCGILVLDDVDKLWCHEDSPTIDEAKKLSANRRIQMMMCALDNLTTSDDIMIILAANDISQFPDFMKREGRIHHIIEIPKLSAEAMQGLVEFHFPHIKNSHTVIGYAERDRKFTGAQFIKIINGAIDRARRRDKVTARDVEDGMQLCE
jgi:hypothetical protein